MPDEDATAPDELPDDPVDELPAPFPDDPEGEPGPPLDVAPQAMSAMPSEAAPHGQDSLEAIRGVITSLPFESGVSRGWAAARSIAAAMPTLPECVTL